jgi:hypothetical protein
MAGVHSQANQCGCILCIVAVWWENESMPRVCRVCKHPQRLEIERALLNRTALRTISDLYGPSKTALIRHRDHIAGVLAQQTAERETTRSRTLLEDIRVGEGRAERLYRHAEAILAGALQDNDRRSALAAIRCAVDVMTEARGYLELRGELVGELGRDKTPGPMCIQVICPGVPANGPMPMIAYQPQGEAEVVEIAVTQH